MKEDLKNVIITFGFIALVLTNGSFAYQKNVRDEYILAVKQEELQRAKMAEQLALAAQSSLLEQARQEELKKQQIAREQLAIQNAKNQDTLNQTLAAKAKADLARQQALALQQQQQALALAQQKAQAAAQASAPTVVRPSRSSRAS